MLIRNILERKDALEALTVGPDDTAHYAAEFLAERKIGAAVVVSPTGAIAGIVSERDIVRGYAEHRTGLADQSVESLMTSPVVTCSPDTSIADAAQLMDAHHIRHLPVVEGGTLIGVVSIRDIVARRLLSLETDVEVLRGQLLDRPDLGQASH